jgi:tellurite resistance protein
LSYYRQVLGPELKKLVTSEHARQRAVAYARSLTLSGSMADDAALAAELDAAIEAMYLMAAADGEVAKDELMQLTASIQSILEASEADGAGSRVELGLPLLRLDRELERFKARLEAEGLEARIASLGTRLTTDEGKKLTYRLAVAVAFVDDFVANAESHALSRLAEVLGFDQDQALALMQEVHATLG